MAGIKTEDFLESRRPESDAGRVGLGEENGVLPPDYDRRLASRLPNTCSSIRSLCCGHMPQLQCPRTLERMPLELPGASGLWELLCTCPIRDTSNREQTSALETTGLRASGVIVLPVVLPLT